MTAMYSFIAEEKANPESVWSAAEMCRVLEVSRQGFYDWEQRPPSQRQVTDRLLAVEIEAIWECSARSYGPPRCGSSGPLVISLETPRSCIRDRCRCGTELRLRLGHLCRQRPSRAARFFADTVGVDEIISAHRGNPGKAVWRFIPVDYRTELDVADRSVGLLVSLSAGFVSEHCTRIAHFDKCS